MSRGRGRTYTHTRAHSSCVGCGLAVRGLRGESFESLNVSGFRSPRQRRSLVRSAEQTLFCRGRHLSSRDFILPVLVILFIHALLSSVTHLLAYLGRIYPHLITSYFSKMSVRARDSLRHALLLVLHFGDFLARSIRHKLSYVLTGLPTKLGRTKDHTRNSTRVRGTYQGHGTADSSVRSRAVQHVLLLVGPYDKTTNY